MNFTSQQLDIFQQASDVVADKLVHDLYAEMEAKSVGQLFSALINDLGEIDYSTLPKTLQQYFIENQDLPAWTDKEQFKKAEDLFLTIGPMYSACLLLRALPIGYTSEKTVKVLTSTGYLSKDMKQGTAKRLLETTQFVFNVMGKDALTKDGIGTKHTLKVRFLHAIIRYHLLKHNWDTKRYGVPINQLDMAGTILTFSVGAIKGMDMVEANLSVEERDAIVHYWAAIGHIIGVDAELLPTNYQDAEDLYEMILAHQAAYSEDGIALTDALCNFLRGFLPVKYMPNFPEYLLEYLIDNKKYSNMIGVRKQKNIIEKATFNGVIKHVKLTNKYRKSEIIQFIMKPSKSAFSDHLIPYFDKEFDLKLTIPEKIESAWGLRKTAKIA